MFVAVFVALYLKSPTTHLAGLIIVSELFCSCLCHWIHLQRIFEQSVAPWNSRNDLEVEVFYYLPATKPPLSKMNLS